MKSALKILHPYIFSITPILYFCSNNFNEFPLKDMVIVFSTVLIFTFILVRLLTLSKSLSTASILASVILIPFFNYSLITSFFFNKNNIQLEGFVLFSLIFFLALVVRFFWVSKRNFSSIETILSVVAFTLLTTTTIQFFDKNSLSFYDRIRQFHKLQNKNNDLDELSVLKKKQELYVHAKNLPDVYYIILDMYPSNQTLVKNFGFDNSLLTKKLSKLGFYVAQNSFSNYPITHLSISSSLNMDYINLQSEDVLTTDMRLYRDLIYNSKVIELFRENGYSFYTFSSGWHLTEELSKKADVYLKYSIAPFNALYDSILKLTMLKFFSYDMANQQQYSFDKLSELLKVKEKEPKFVFLHMYAPHPPFFFDKLGNKRVVPQNEDIDSKEVFIDELQYINLKIEKFSEDVSQKTGIKPIIIFQGDHGTGLPIKHPKNPKELYVNAESSDYLQSRFGILNAYYVPDKIKEKLYPTITPVNTFRLIVSELFGSNTNLLKDESYFTWWDDSKNNFRNVTNKLHASSGA